MNRDTERELKEEVNWRRRRCESTQHTAASQGAATQQVWWQTHSRFGGRHTQHPHSGGRRRDTLVWWQTQGHAVLQTERQSVTSRLVVRWKWASNMRII